MADPDLDVLPLGRPSAVAASAWSALEIVLRQGLQFAVTVVLARLLSPEDFGTFALLAFLTSFAIVFLQGGLTIALIQRQNTTGDEESAVFWWNFIASLVVGAGFVAGAPLFADFFDQPVLRLLVVVAAAHLVLSAAGAVQTALLTREMRFDLLTRAGILSSVVSGVVAVTAALMGAGIWALALQLATQAAVNTAALWLIADWRPQFHFQFATIRQFFGFGAAVSIGNVLDVFYTSGINLLVGKLYGVRELGFYNRAATTQLLPSSMLSAVVGRVTLPLLSSKDGDAAALRQSLRLAIGATMLLNVPAMTGLALLADQVVEVLFGERWLPAAPILVILALSGVLLPLHVINLQYVLARAQSRTFMRIELAKKSLGIACVVAGSLFGVIGLAWSQVAVSIIALLINAVPAGRELHYGVYRQLHDVAGIFFASLIMAGCVVLLKSVLPTGAAATLAICSAAGALVYLAAGWLARFDIFRTSAAFLATSLIDHRQAKRR